LRGCPRSEHKNILNKFRITRLWGLLCGKIP
jgi:hypothetical protein